MTVNGPQTPRGSRDAMAALHAMVPGGVGMALVKHAGQTYWLLDLLVHLSPDDLEQVEATAPHTGQTAWDEVILRWPMLADEAAARCKPVAYPG